MKTNKEKVAKISKVKKAPKTTKTKKVSPTEKLAEVDKKFAASLQDLADGLSRAFGESAEAGLNPQKSIYDVLGWDNGTYENDDEEGYANTLDKLSKFDLQKECIRVGLLPHDNRNLMVKRLLREFVSYFDKKKIPIKAPAQPVMTDAAQAVLDKYK